MPVERPGDNAKLLDILDRVLDKGIVIDAWLRVSLMGLDLLAVEARVVVASIDTYTSRSEVLSQVLPVAAPARAPALVEGLHPLPGLRKTRTNRIPPHARRSRGAAAALSRS